MLNAYFSPNSFSYGVFTNIGSGAVPGRLPNHGFREGSGAGCGTDSGKVPGQVQEEGSGKVLGRVSRSSGRVPGGFLGTGSCFRNRVQGKVLGQVRVPCGASPDQGGSGSGAGSRQGSKQVTGGFRAGPGKNALKTIWLGTGFRDGSFGEPVSVARAPALVLV